MAEIKKRNLFRYDGGITVFDKSVADSFKAETWATSKWKAECNIIYQYKKQYNIADHIPVRLTAEICIIPECSISSNN